MDEDIAHAAGQLAADGNAGMAILHQAMADDDILTGLAQSPPVRIARRLDGDAIVARVEHALFDQYAVAGFRVDPVIVRPMAGAGDAAEGDV
ncbi:hypothetical protein LTR94_034939, partial [Friedmanniomyces endolithicus]